MEEHLLERAFVHWEVGIDPGADALGVLGPGVGAEENTTLLGLVVDVVGRIDADTNGKVGVADAAADLGAAGELAGPPPHVAEADADFAGGAVAEGADGGFGTVIEIETTQVHRMHCAHCSGVEDVSVG